jgi:hypothetical protein
MNDQDLHWYLMDVDIVHHNMYIYMLDSLPCENRKWSRQKDVLKMVFMIHTIFQQSFISFNGH